jgi:Tim44-like domain
LIRQYWRVLVWVELILLSLPAWARLGGGSSYRSSSSSSSGSSRSYSGGSSYSSSSGSSYSSGSGSGGDVSGLFLLVILVVVIALVWKYQPGKDADISTRLKAFGEKKTWVTVAVGFVAALVVFSNIAILGLVVLGYFVFYRRASEDDRAALTRGVGLLFSGNLAGQFQKLRQFGEGGLVGELAGFPTDRRKYHETVLGVDPNFSLPIFREFAVLLYCQAIKERGEGRFVQSRPYLTSKVAGVLEKRSSGPVEVLDIVVGSVNVVHAHVFENDLVLTVAFEANYLEKSDRVRAFVANEEWKLERKLGVLSKPPESVSRLNCPGCGFGGDFPANGVCPQCQTSNVHGEVDWVVSQVRVTALEEFVPHQAEGSGAEVGTSLPTTIHPELGRRREDFLARHSDFSWDDFWQKTNGIFLKLQEAWSRREPSMARPHETDVLFRTHRYWIEDYQRRARINQLEDIKIARWELSNIVVDAYYESVTARVFASMRDFTTDEAGKVLYGDPKKPRQFTEYWTFIRRVGHRAAKGDSLCQCPACGAPLDKVNQTGECEYCETVVTLGDFDWVLSNIEQDEVYTLS